MALRYLLDTDTCIYLAKHSSAKLMQRFAQEPADSAAISVVTLGELRFGAEQSQQRARAMEVLERFSQSLRVLPLEPSAAGPYGELRAKLKRAGTPLGASDLWIAAHALSLNLILISNNEREFVRVGGLQVENWLR